MNYSVNEQFEKKLPFDPYSVFSIKTDKEFNSMALKTYFHQVENNAIYAEYCQRIGALEKLPQHYTEIPFLPISFFKTHEVKSFTGDTAVTFSSSGTTGMQASKHFVSDIHLYEHSFLNGFTERFGAVEDYIILGLLPSYLEREGSSLIYMVESLIKHSQHPASGFFLHDHEALLKTIQQHKGSKKIMLIGVAYALLDLGEAFSPDLSNCIIMETGGMKGQRKELIKTALHEKLCSYFNVDTIYSEYGMTELLSQAYSKGTAFKTPPWMKVLTRAYNDPFTLTSNKTGGINVIDLANFHSCSFIATQDLGRVYNEHFEVLGRFDHADIRGCNLLVQ